MISTSSLYRDFSLLYWDIGEMATLLPVLRIAISDDEGRDSDDAGDNIERTESLILALVVTDVDGGLPITITSSIDTGREDSEIVIVLCASKSSVLTC